MKATKAGTPKEYKNSKIGKSRKSEKQMALPSSFNTLGDLCDDKTIENEVLSRLKQLAQQWLPNGWRNWQVVQAAADEQSNWINKH
nr:unnamed protein product [Callosobruchus analis]